MSLGDECWWPRSPLSAAGPPAGELSSSLPPFTEFTVSLLSDTPFLLLTSAARETCDRIRVAVAVSSWRRSLKQASSLAYDRFSSLTWRLFSLRDPLPRRQDLSLWKFLILLFSPDQVFTNDKTESV